MTLVTKPPNYKWQQFLKRTFPAHPLSPRHVKEARVELKSLEEAAASGRDDPDRSPRLSLRNTLLKWFVDCIVVGAAANTVAFLVIMGFLKGQSGPQIWRNVQTVSPRPVRFPCPRLP